MRTHHLAGRPAHRRDAVGYAVRRVASSMAVVAALVAIGAAAVVDAIGLPFEVALLASTAVFVVLSIAAGTAVAPPRASVESSARAASSVQLGPDIEQVVSRRTGART